MKLISYVVATFAMIAFVAGFGTMAEAYNSWNGYHWDITARDSIKYPLRIGDNVTQTWDATLAGASYDWNKSVVKNKVVSGASNSNCDPVLGRSEVCNSSYGDNGWLGLTQLWIAPGTSHITQATLKLNDTYFVMPEFNTNAWKIETLCHEMGHIYGLDHQDTDFNNANLGTCLDFTGDPDGTVAGQLSNLHPNQLDYDTIRYVYNHKHTKPRSGTAAVNFSAGSSNAVSDWGEPTGHKNNGKNTEFVKEFKDGSKIVTHVRWVE
jgi:hypothetical protein